MKGVEYFLPCPSAPLLLCIPASYILLPSSTFPVSPFLLILVSSRLNGYFSVFICVRSTELTTKSPRTLRRTIIILYLDHKKARERFWYETQKMQLDTDLHRFAQIFQRLKQNHIHTFWGDICISFGWFKCEIWKILKSLILGWFPVLPWKLRCCWRYINSIHFS